MKKKSIFIVLFFVAVTFLNAQNFSLSAKSGDVELDASLNDINLKAKGDLKIFKQDLAIEFSIGEPKIDKMIIDLKMSPADTYMVLQVANLTKKEPDAVLTSFNSNKDKGWGVIAKEMGIKPGSSEFHALKGKAKGKKDKAEKGNGNGKGKRKKK